MYHKPVLLQESTQWLIHKPEGIYVDCTFGGGGHSKNFLNTLTVNGHLYAMDQDQDAEENAFTDSRFTFISQNFKNIKNSLRFLGIEKVDGIFADLGVSSHQFDQGTRGFSTRFEGPLDMRMNKRQEKTAQSILANYTEDELAHIFYNYGELRNSKKLAKNIVENRAISSIETTEDLKKLFHYIPAYKQNQFFAQLFQAIRIEVNDELDALKTLLLESHSLLNPKGRLVMISYHSLEDRLVKNYLKKGLLEGEPEKDIFGNWDKLWDLPKGKAIVPNQTEINENPRSRSAKLRIGIKI